ncbi:DUF3883 domain-containing protein [Rhodococcus antarcticus]|uniref:DUF3883 domain-containing protein n=1 Tax=Rhodococcus antarcticus TaxID=2987751 RepID=A0ABY6NYP3_9NOCA|nr:DUF3883 domain-containing protein [Rhodococcus antarcticus]UZJ24519.1 DUF3883 domain-containing protein [Rhodococcus antarcticus]
MVLNLRLVDVQYIEPETDSLGRSWYGYDESRSDVDLWAQNRGQHSLEAAKVEAERYATLSYRGRVVVVVALTGWEPSADLPRGTVKKALIGDVLGPGDSAYDALHGAAVPRDRGTKYLVDGDYGVDGLEVLAGRSGSTGSSQGWQSDPVRRKQVEDAAQNRLMAEYRADGWTVTDTRYGNPYDAVARRAGEVVYLEAKGTQTSGGAVLISAGEVAHARRYPGQCVLGVLSDIVLNRDGNVDPTSGTFSVLPFAPQDEDLTAIGYRWDLPAS